MKEKAHLSQKRICREKPKSITVGPLEAVELGKAAVSG